MNKETKINIGDTGNQHEDGNQPMGTPYEKDVVAWAEEQAALLRAGKLASVDIEHIAEEIEDVGKSERREYASRMAVLMAHLLKWQYQPERRTSSWSNTILTRRAAIERRLRKTPSPKPMLTEEDWIADMRGDAREQAANETRIGFAEFPESCPWPMSSILEQAFFPA